MDHTTNMSFKLINVSHRQYVFTIDENLRHFFLKDRELLNYLFNEITNVVSRTFFNMNMSKNYTSGFITILHSFYRDLKWNHHIHYLTSEGGYNDDGYWCNVKCFDYICLHNAFRTFL